MDNSEYHNILIENGLITYVNEVWPSLKNSQTCKHNLIELVLSLSIEKTVYFSHSEQVFPKKFELLLINYAKILLLFPIIEMCFCEYRENHKYLVNILWIFKQMTENTEKSFDFLLKMQSFEEILECLRGKDVKVTEIALKIVNNLLSGSNEQIQARKRGKSNKTLINLGPFG